MISNHFPPEAAFPAEHPKPRWNKRDIFLFFTAVFLCLIIFYFAFLSAPADFPLGTTIKIEQGLSLRGVSMKLKQEHIIRSSLAFEAFMILFNRERRAISTDYYFENKLPVYEVARRISRGEHHITPIAVTIPEGFDSVQIADTFASKLANFDKNKFISEVKGLEGHLFPDTYFFLITDNEEDVLHAINENFNKKITLVLPEITASGKSKSEIITMASIIEREAKGDIDRAFISGILWKRLKAGMSLQVDAAPVTYQTKGLPKSPISNPGLAAIKAAIHPQGSPYLYYLHDKDGNIHYARTFAEHIGNKLKYLK